MKRCVAGQRQHEPSPGSERTRFPGCLSLDPQLRVPSRAPFCLAYFCHVSRVQIVIIGIWYSFLGSEFNAVEAQ